METTVFIQIDQEIVGVDIVEFQAVVVYAEKSACYSNRHSLVAINEWWFCERLSHGAAACSRVPV